MIPRCSPDSARMCDAPLSRKLFMTLSSSEDLSPVSRALTRGAVPSCGNGIDEIIDLKSAARPAKSGFPATVPRLVNADVAAQKTPAVRNSSRISTCRRSAEVRTVNVNATSREVAEEMYAACTEIRLRSSPDAAPKVNANASGFMSAVSVIGVRSVTRPLEVISLLK